MLRRSLHGAAVHGCAVQALAAAVPPRCCLSTRAKPRRAKKTPPRLLALAPGVQAFHRVHGHFAIPYRHRLSALELSHRDVLDDPAIDVAALDGMPIGRTLHSFLTSSSHQADHHDVWRRLHDLGVPVAVDWAQFVWEETIVAALRTFEALHGHLCVPQMFVVPHDDAQWPRATWGLPLGRRANHLRRCHREGTLPLEQRQALDALGFAWDAADYRWHERILPALRRFHALHGHSNVSSAFRVPPNDRAWPRQTWGLRLGTAVTSIRSGAFASQVEASLDELNRLAFSFDVHDTTWRTKILPALTRFHELHGHCIVPLHFVVPDRAPWPDRLHGLALGQAVNNIRKGKTHQEHASRDRAQLEAIGFAWSAVESRWRELVLPSLLIYAQVHGSPTSIPNAFVVPAQAPWPKAAWGLTLGMSVYNIRHNGACADLVLRDRQELEAAGYEWLVAKSIKSSRSHSNDEEEALN